MLSNMVWFRVQDIDIDKVEAAYDRRMYNEKGCSKCDYKKERFSEEYCAPCGNYKGRHITYMSKEGKNGQLIGLPRGDTHNFHKVGIDVSKLKILDRRNAPKMSSKRLGLEWTRELYPEQEKLARKWIRGNYQGRMGGLDEPYGLIVAPPRTGKTTLVLNIAYRLGLRVLVIANQDDLLRQFCKDLEDSTDILDLEAFHNRKFHGIAKSNKDLKGLDFAFTTWQSFDTDSGKMTTEEVSKYFGLVFVDEAHRGAAPVFSKRVNAMNVMYKGGVTATPNLKSGMDFRIKQIIGPVVATGVVEALTPSWTLTLTGIKPKKGISFWPSVLSFLANHEGREDAIIDRIIRDVKDGHSVVVPVDRKAQAIRMAAKLNQRRIPAAAFVGGTNREKIQDDANSGRIKVVIGMRSIISTGVNVKPWSCIYEITPISNDPNFYQEYKRVCTVMKGKKPPVIRMYVDDMGISYGCFKTCWLQLQKLPCTPRTKERALEIIQGRKRGGNAKRGTAGAPNPFKIR